MTGAVSRGVWVVASEDTAGRWAEVLVRKGCDAHALSWSEIRPVAAEAETRRALQRAGPPDRVLLTSRQAVGCWPDALPRDLPLACVGEATAAAAREAGLEVREVGPGTGIGLAEGLLSDGRVQRLLFLRGRQIRREGVERLLAGGLRVEEVVVYEARARAGFDAEVAAAPRPLAFVVGSPRGAKALARALEAAGRKALLALPAVAIGEPTAEALRESGFGSVEAASTPSISGIEALLALRLRTDPSP